MSSKANRSKTSKKKSAGIYVKNILSRKVTQEPISKRKYYH